MSGYYPPLTYRSRSSRNSMNKQMSLCPASMFHFLVFCCCCERLLRRTSMYMWRRQIHHQPRAFARCVKCCCGMFLRFRGETVSPHCPKAFSGGGEGASSKLSLLSVCDVTVALGPPHTHTHKNRRYITINHDMALVPQKSLSGEMRKEHRWER